MRALIQILNLFLLISALVIQIVVTLDDSITNKAVGYLVVIFLLWLHITIHSLATCVTKNRSTYTQLNINK
jgi:hypothetical protein